jgi:ribulose-phosphate 3-epimerase
MKASCSVWSADLLALRNAVDSLSGHADEFHVDVMDGNVVPDILFGLDFVAAIRAITETPLDVHLMTYTTAEWIERSVEAGAARVAVHAEFCRGVRAALRRIESLGSMPVLVLPLDAVIGEDSLPWGCFQRILLMGTEIGIKGAGLDPRVFERIEALIRLRAGLGVEFEIFVDGGIRPETVPQLAEAGAEGVVPGSLVFGAQDPIATLSWIHSLAAGRCAPKGDLLSQCRAEIAIAQCDGTVHSFVGSAGTYRNTPYLS